MAKKAYVYDGSAWQDLSSSTADLSTYQKTSRTGLISVVPTSVSVGSGSGSVATNGAVTFTGASSVSINGCFLSTYDNYKLELAYEPTSTAGWSTIQMSSAGTPLTTSTYTYGRRFDYSSSAGSYESSTAATSISLVYSSAAGYAFSQSEIANPYLAKQTLLTGTGLTNGSASYFSWASGVVQNTTSYDGFKITFPAALSGTIRIYGYNNNA